MDGRRALVVRTGALGDVLVLRPAIAALQDAGFRVTLLAPAWAGAALVGRGRGEALACLDSDRADLAALWSRGAEPPAAVRDALGAAGLALAVTGDADLAANLGRTGARVIQAPPIPPPGVHASDAVTHALGLPAAASLPPLAFTAAERDAARPWRERLPHRFLAIHPGSGSPRKNWPGFAGLARALVEGAPFLVAVGPADAEAAAPFASLASAVRAERLPPRTLGALLADAGVFVGNDSGASHLAAAAGAPTLALFGPTDPAQWAPRGPDVRVLRSSPIAGLAPAAVEGAARDLWNR